MLKAIVGRKLRMTKALETDGRMVALTAIQAGPCPIVQVKTPERDGYSALQVGYEADKRTRGPNKPIAGHFKNAGVDPVRMLKEFRVPSIEEGMEVGQSLTVTGFEAGDRVDVSAVSKGRGFQGVVRRHGFHGGRSSHGSMFHRAPGAIGAAADPSRVFKGTALPGQMGAEKVTVQNLTVYQVDPENHILYLRGAIPGPSGGLVTIMATTKAQGKRKAK